MKYRIEGDPMPVVICDLDSDESMITEKGAMVWMSTNMHMETASGGAKKAWGRLLAGESMFQNIYTAQDGPGMIAFGSSFMGAIIPIDLSAGREIIIQKSSFLASETSVEWSTYMHEKASTGFFGGEGFIMQKLSGTGTAFIEIDGAPITYELEEGEQMLVGSGHVAMMDSTCKMTIERVRGAKNVMFGGEGMFNTLITGPGTLVLQTMPLGAFAAVLKDRMSTT